LLQSNKLKSASAAFHNPPAATELSTIPPKTILDLQRLFLIAAKITLFYTTKNIA
jgi:hypothetical protein